jgi:parvulin-like peptidyl-prolyl isomerase
MHSIPATPTDSQQPLHWLRTATLAGLLALSLGLPPALFATATAPPAAADAVLATFDSGVVHVSDVEREMRFLPPNEARYRDEMEMPEEIRWRDWIQRMALRQMASAEAEAQGLADEPVLREQAHQSARRWLVEQWRADCYGAGLHLPGQQELERLAQANVKHLPPRLRLSHIFVRTRTAEDEARAQRDLAAWRQEIGNDFETFQRYAREHSDSQTAARGGPLGFFRQGKLPEEIEAALYPLPEGTVSPPLRLRGGWHLFFIERNIPAQTTSLELAASKLRGELKAKALAECRATALAEARKGRPVEITGAQIRVGEWTVARQLLAQVSGESEGQAPDVEAIDVEAIVEEELLFQACLASDWPQPAHRRRLEDLAADVYLGALIDRFQVAHLEAPTEEQERAFFDQYADRYKTRAQIDARLLTSTVPEDKDPLRWMDDYTELARRLRDGEISWPEAERQCAPECQLSDPGPIDQTSFAGRYGPVAFQEVQGVPIGGVTEPVQDQMRFHIMEAQGRTETRPQSFEEARPRVRRALLHNQRSALSATLVRQLLASHQFALTAEGTARTRPPTEVEPAETQPPEAPSSEAEPSAAEPPTGDGL